MDYNISTLERAFQIARSGHAGSVRDIKARLKSEGYPLAAIEGTTLMAQLRKLVKAARPA